MDNVGRERGRGEGMEGRGGEEGLTCTLNSVRQKEKVTGQMHA
jgi:hypothetical protein